MVNNLVTIVMSQINTFTSHDALNEDAEGPELERGTWPVVAWDQRGGSSNHIGARAPHLTAAGVSVFGARTDDYPCRTDRRSVGGGDVQDSSRCADAIAFLFRAEWFDAERDRHPCPAEVFDGAASAQPKWLIDRQNIPPSIWNSLSIVCSQSNCSRSMGYW